MHTHTHMRSCACTKMLRLAGLLGRADRVAELSQAPLVPDAFIPCHTWRWRGRPLVVCVLGMVVVQPTSRSGRAACVACPLTSRSSGDATRSAMCIPKWTWAVSSECVVRVFDRIRSFPQDHRLLRPASHGFVFSARGPTLIIDEAAVLAVMRLPNSVGVRWRRSSRYTTHIHNQTCSPLGGPIWEAHARLPHSGASGGGRPMNVDAAPCVSCSFFVLVGQLGARSRKERVPQSYARMLPLWPLGPWRLEDLSTCACLRTRSRSLRLTTFGCVLFRFASKLERFATPSVWRERWPARAEIL